MLIVIRMLWKVARCSNTVRGTARVGRHCDFACRCTDAAVRYVTVAKTHRNQRCKKFFSKACPCWVRIDS
ncbi:hypothetical protein, partial [Xanthomonas phaseoli]|uniref:hypothetical protein n=1 Tax=Xanthomonas phaseoli TaxID=1985254 RepID=UPI001969CF02